MLLFPRHPVVVVPRNKSGSHARRLVRGSILMSQPSSLLPFPTSLKVFQAVTFGNHTRMDTIMGTRATKRPRLGKQISTIGIIANTASYTMWLSSI